MASIKNVFSTIKERNNFLLMGHVDPDGDCIGSLFALKWGLDLLGKKSIVLLENDPLLNFQHLKINQDDYKLFTDFKNHSYPENDLSVIALDAGDIDRLGNGKDLALKYFLINIDHHPDNPLYGDINLVLSEKAAVGEIIYDFCEKFQLDLTNKIGTAIATAIIADTGGLKYQNTSARIYRIIADLKENSVDIYQVYRSVFANYSYQSVKLKGLALSTLKICENGKVAWVKVNQSILAESEADPADASGLVSYARDIRDVEVGLVFTELENGNTKVSFRSNDYCPVNEIAAFFGGGGHARAAGCTIEKDLDQVVEMVLTKVNKYV